MKCAVLETNHPIDSVKSGDDDYSSLVHNIATGHMLIR